MSFCAVRDVRWGPIFDAGFEGGRASAEPELFRRRSLLFSVARGPGRSGPDALPMFVVELDCGGKLGRRFGGLDVDTCGLNVTLRGGFGEGIGRDELLSFRSSGDASETWLEEAIVERVYGGNGDLRAGGQEGGSNYHRPRCSTSICTENREFVLLRRVHGVCSVGALQLSSLIRKLEHVHELW